MDMLITETEKVSGGASVVVASCGPAGGSANHPSLPRSVADPPPKTRPHGDLLGRSGRFGRCLGSRAPGVSGRSGDGRRSWCAWWLRRRALGHPEDRHIPTPGWRHRLLSLAGSVVVVRSGRGIWSGRGLLSPYCVWAASGASGGPDIRWGEPSSTWPGPRRRRTRRHCWWTVDRSDQLLCCLDWEVWRETERPAGGSPLLDRSVTPSAGGQDPLVVEEISCWDRDMASHSNGEGPRPRVVAPMGRAIMPSPGSRSVTGPAEVVAWQEKRTLPGLSD